MEEEEEGETINRSTYKQQGLSRIITNNAAAPSSTCPQSCQGSGFSTLCISPIQSLLVLSSALELKLCVSPLHLRSYSVFIYPPKSYGSSVRLHNRHTNEKYCWLDWHLLPGTHSLVHPPGPLVCPLLSSTTVAKLVVSFLLPRETAHTSPMTRTLGSGKEKVW